MLLSPFTPPPSVALPLFQTRHKEIRQLFPFFPPPPNALLSGLQYFRYHLKAATTCHSTWTFVEERSEAIRSLQLFCLKPPSGMTVYGAEQKSQRTERDSVRTKIWRIYTERNLPHPRDVRDEYVPKAARIHVKFWGGSRRSSSWSGKQIWVRFERMNLVLLPVNEVRNDSQNFVLNSEHFLEDSKEK